MSWEKLTTAIEENDGRELLLHGYNSTTCHWEFCNLTCGATTWERTRSEMRRWKEVKLADTSNWFQHNEILLGIISTSGYRDWQRIYKS